MRWAGYTRVSRVGDRAERLVSPELQADRIKAYAQARGLDVHLLEPELDVSGGKIDRPILGQVIDGIRDGTYAGIIVAQLDRLSRMDITDALSTIRQIEQAGGRVIAVAENLDESTPEGRMARNMFLAVGDMQLGRYSAQIAAAKRRAVDAGIWPTPRPPTGYTVTARKRGGDGKLKVDREVAPRVRRAFELRAAGRPWSVIADTLNVGTSGAARIIRNRAYLGEINLGELRNPTAHEPIVTRDLWEAAQSQQPRPTRNPATRPMLLAGLVRCAGCRRLMSPDRRESEIMYRCYRRSAAGVCEAPAIVGHRRLEALVERTVLAHLEGIEATGQTRGSDRLASIERELQAAEAELAAYQEVTSVSEHGADVFMAGMRSRIGRVEELRADLANARALHGGRGELRVLLEQWPGLSVEQRRHVLGGAIDVVWVRKGRHDLASRVRVIAAGYGPGDLPRPGFRRLAVEPAEWPDGDLPGEIGLVGAEDLAEGAGGADA